MEEATPQKKEVLTTGRRKEAVARVRLKLGKGDIVVNGRNLTEYFPTINLQNQIKRPLVVCEYLDKVSVSARTQGGGISGQAGAVSLGISRALVEIDVNLKRILRKEELLTRDPRAKERKKYGKRGARRSVQWTKR